jgi:hypothetical protein
VFAHEDLSVFDERVSYTNVGVAFERDGGCHRDRSRLKGLEVTVGGDIVTKGKKKKNFNHVHDGVWILDAVIGRQTPNPWLLHDIQRTIKRFRENNLKRR